MTAIKNLLTLLLLNSSFVLNAATITQLEQKSWYSGAADCKKDQQPAH